MSHVKPLTSTAFELTYPKPQNLNLQLFIKLITGSIKVHRHIMAKKKTPHIVYRTAVETPDRLLIRGHLYYHKDEEVPDYMERYLNGATYPALHVDNGVVLGVKF